MPLFDWKVVVKGDEAWPPQTLTREQIGAFLFWMFGEVARKPDRLKLRETASVARYLKAIAIEMPGNKVERIEHAADVIWGTLMDRGEIKPATRAKVILFLKRHAQTYLSSFDVGQMVKQIRRLPEPTRHRENFKPPNLMGKGRSVQGDRPAKLDDDLSERIYAAYHALRRARTRDARGRIANTLNQFGIKRVMQEWGGPEVNERVVHYENRMVRQHRLQQIKDKIQRRKKIVALRQGMVDVWIHGFHFARSINEKRTEQESKPIILATPETS